MSTKKRGATTPPLPLKENISDITFLRSPLKTLYYFSVFAKDNITYHGHYLLTHPSVLFVLLPLLLIYLVFDNIPGAHEVYISEIEEIFLFLTWWVGLGVLSSIGLGTGMHTGILFLFPHVMKVCLAASECQSTNFSTRGDMWLRSDPNLFVCQNPAAAAAASEVAFLDVFKKVFFPCFLWGTGTAIGEIPPYAISKAAATAGIKNSEFEEIKESKSKYAFLDSMKVWMINFLQKHGFIGIILMSAWPNAAFDLVGMCCGHFLMPFWSFFLATFIGKALLKVNVQACFFIVLFTESYVARLVGWIEHIVPSNMDLCRTYAKKECHIMVRDMLHTARSKFYSSSGTAVEGDVSWLKSGWNFVIFLFIAFFVISCVEQFAKAEVLKQHKPIIEIHVEKKNK